jgi:uncharacterized secreted repeat protein (TIGR03808 family)
MFNRRCFLVSGAAALAVTSSARAAGVFAPGLNPGSSDDQSAAFQRAIDESARTRIPLALAPGVYRVGGLRLPAGASLTGVRGATRLVYGGGPSLLMADHADDVTLSGLVIDGLNRALPQRRGLVQIENTRGLKIADCDVLNVGGTGIQLSAVEGQVVDTRIENAGTAIHSDDAQGLLIARNIIADAADNGIRVWRNTAGDDGTIVADNRIGKIANRSGGSGQYGNAINVFRAANVIVRGNRISDCAFSAVRGNAASNLHIESNAVTDAREVALYAEFGFEGAMIANNTVDGAAIGVSVTNFNDGGRLAVVQGNLIRNLYAKRPTGTDLGDGAGFGIAVEADAAVTGNLVENAPFAGIALGYGRYLRDCAATGNVVRGSSIGIAVSVAGGAGTALIANNVISGAARGAVVGMDHKTVVTGDLLKEGGALYTMLTLSGNRAS